jgi:hypothetical protein
MALLVPFAAPLPEPGWQALQGLALPRLQALLARLAPDAEDVPDDAPGRTDAAAEWVWSPPHERALAQALGWRGAAGRLPWAARAAAADGIEVGDLAWGLVTPCHWHLGTEQLTLTDPAQLLLDEAESRALFAAVRPLFTGAGWALTWGAPLRWYTAHDSLAGLACASLDRVVGRNVDPWLGSDAAARPVRRLQAEVQMLLHAHPLNAERERRGLPVVNSFWLSGCGSFQPEATPAPPIDARLRGPALAGDWAAWARAWQTLDEGPLAEALAGVTRGEPFTLTLCGERGWRRWRSGGGGWARRLRALWSAPTPAQALAGL